MHIWTGRRDGVLDWTRQNESRSQGVVDVEMWHRLIRLSTVAECLTSVAIDFQRHDVNIERRRLISVTDIRRHTRTGSHSMTRTSINIRMNDVKLPPILTRHI